MNIKTLLFCTLYFVSVTAYAVLPNEFNFEVFKQILRDKHYIDNRGSVWELQRKAGNFDLFIDTLEKIKKDPTLKSKYTYGFDAVVTQLPIEIFAPCLMAQTSEEQYYYIGQITFSDELDNMGKYEKLFGYGFLLNHCEVAFALVYNPEPLIKIN